MAATLTLGIETSCDETSAAVVDDLHVRSLIVASQARVHAHWGGVVPEVASRQHMEALVPCVEAALAEAAVGMDAIGLVAVTQGPGLIGSLMVGVSFAKALAFARGLPLVGVNHLVGHLYSAFLDREPVFPVIGLIVSGGHTELWRVDGHGRIRVLGRTLDDAAGEALDKVARALGLGYPGGPALERLAATGDARRCPLPRVRTAHPLDFSFSGLKTAVLEALGRVQPADAAAAFQAAVVEELVRRAVEAARSEEVDRIALVGGVAANRSLGAALEAAAGAYGIKAWAAEARYTGDNAAMIAAAGRFVHAARGGDPLTLMADALARP